jgi:ribosomal protein S18 acetylase RimI-like enzyme
MSSEASFNIRAATDADSEFIRKQMHRLTDFGPPAWRNPAQMYRIDADVILAHLHQRPETTAIFIAEDFAGARLGFIHMRTGSDHYYREEHGHVEDLVVTAEAQGRGVARALLATGEEWARSRGYRILTLSVFAQNERARALYERQGFGADIVRYVKIVNSD